MPNKKPPVKQGAYKENYKMLTIYHLPLPAVHRSFGPAPHRG
jgi:hypothetical protein